MTLKIAALGSTLALALVGSNALAGNMKGGQAGQSDTDKNVVQVAKDAGQFKTLLTALDAAELTQTLGDAKSVTLFAPTDAAFAKIPKADLDKLLADKEALRKVLLMHSVGAKLYQRTIENVTGAKMLDGSQFAFRQDGEAFYIGQAQIISTNIHASNGLIQVIDTVLMPEAAPQ